MSYVHIVSVYVFNPGFLTHMEICNISVSLYFGDRLVQCWMNVSLEVNQSSNSIKKKKNKQLIEMCVNLFRLLTVRFLIVLFFVTLLMNSLSFSSSAMGDSEGFVTCRHTWILSTLSERQCVL